MSSNHHISAADNILVGAAAYYRHMYLYDGRRGYLCNTPSYRSFGAAAAASAVALISAATGAELPNNATKTYTTANSGVSPIDGAGLPAVANVGMADGKLHSVWPLDVPRNASLNVTHGASIVAVGITINGFDEYGAAISETLAVTATGTTKTTAGKKAFKWIESYSITSAGDATADTLNLGWGNVFGLRYRTTDKNQVIGMTNGVPDYTQTIVVADDTAPSATTGDARGTFAPSVAADAVKTYGVWQVPSDPSSIQGLFGKNASN